MGGFSNTTRLVTFLLCAVLSCLFCFEARAWRKTDLLKEKGDLLQEKRRIEAKRDLNLKLLHRFKSERRSELSEEFTADSCMDCYPSVQGPCTKQYFLKAGQKVEEFRVVERRPVRLQSCSLLYLGDPSLSQYPDQACKNRILNCSYVRKARAIEDFHAEVISDDSEIGVLETETRSLDRRLKEGKVNGECEDCGRAGDLAKGSFPWDSLIQHGFRAVESIASTGLNYLYQSKRLKTGYEAHLEDLNACKTAGVPCPPWNGGAGSLNLSPGGSSVAPTPGSETSAGAGSIDALGMIKGVLGALGIELPAGLGGKTEAGAPQVGESQGVSSAPGAGTALGIPGEGAPNENSGFVPGEGLNPGTGDMADAHEGELNKKLKDGNEPDSDSEESEDEDWFRAPTTVGGRWDARTSDFAGDPLPNSGFSDGKDGRKVNGSHLVLKISSSATWSPYTDLGSNNAQLQALESTRKEKAKAARQEAKAKEDAIAAGQEAAEQQKRYLELKKNEKKKVTLSKL